MARKFDETDHGEEVIPSPIIEKAKVLARDVGYLSLEGLLYAFRGLVMGPHLGLSFLYLWLNEVRLQTHDKLSWVQRKAQSEDATASVEPVEYAGASDAPEDPEVPQPGIVSKGETAQAVKPKEPKERSTPKAHQEADGEEVSDGTPTKSE